MTSIRARFRLARLPLAACAALLAGTLGGVPAAVADPLAEVQKLVAAGQPADALRRADDALRETPSDPPLRFAKGVLLADAGRADEATAIFRSLTEDYPDLAEPYNNLATLYAAAGRYDEARAALEQALRVNPSYATATENLGDVYAALAARAYGRAMRLDATNRTAAPKLDAVRKVYRRDVGEPAGPTTDPDGRAPSTTPGALAPASR